MFKWLGNRIFWGGLLILGGVVFLLQNLNIIQFGSLFWALLFALGGLFFLSVFLPNRLNWWALIPSLTLFSIALLLTTSYFFPAFSEIWGGSIVLGGIGLSFLLVYLADRNNWWAIIPSGALITLAVVAGVGALLPGVAAGGVFFMGIGLTFALLAVLPTVHGSMWWAWIPAGVLVAMGLLLLLLSGQMTGFLLPVAFIGAGLLLILFTMRRRGK
jgi:hypothetical protein